MDNKLLVKTIVSCVVGTVLWCIIDLIMCAVKNENFVDTFFSPTNIAEVVTIMTLAGISYYVAQSKKKKK